MWRVDVPCAEGREEIAAAQFLRYEIAAADSETKGMARAWFADREEAERCGSELGGSIHEEPEEDWNANWQTSEWTASPLGRRLWLAPPWDTAPVPEGRLRLDMHPGTLFGNGDHPTTRLCLEALERHVAPGMTVADIGCGSGLLSQAALLLGASRAIGCDLDARAVRQATCAAYQGSVDSLMSQSIDLITANIQIGPLNRMLGEIRRALKPNGVAILSGLLEEQIPALEAESSRTEILEGWACVEAHFSC